MAAHSPRRLLWALRGNKTVGNRRVIGLELKQYINPTVEVIPLGKFQIMPRTAC